ncbi:MAG: hypothetical protein ABSA45_12630 [Verrucomicrobiota bacterium]|jgi:hypothetical protein
MSLKAAKHFACLLFSVCTLAQAQFTCTVTSSDDAFLATGSPGNPAGTNLTGLNFGAAGVLAVAPAPAPKGEFQSILKFDLSGAVALFNGDCGTNGWTISGVSLELTSNVGAADEQPDNPIFNSVSGGNFVIEWLADDNWVEGTGRPKSPTTEGVTYDSLPTLLAGAHIILCTNTYSPPGDNVHLTWPLPLSENLVDDIAGGGAVTVRLYAADDQISYLFNSHNFGNGNEPLIHVTATPLLKILSGKFTNGAFHLTGSGGADLTYQVQASSDLAATNWQIIGTAIADGAGAIQFDDINATNLNQRFYRLSR